MNDVAVVPLEAAALNHTGSPTWGLAGEADTEKGTGGEELLNFQAVNGWSSQPLNWCQFALSVPASQ